jgi:glycosyltransferase involved in cell wall biosynthesis
VRKISEALYKKMDMSVGPIDLVHAGRIGREFLAWAALHLARQRKVPFVLTPFHHPRWTGFRYRWYLKLYLQADAVMALTQAEKRILTKLGVASQRIHVIGHAPALSDIKPRTGYFGSGGPVVLFLGQKYAYKGLGQLLKSMPLIWKDRPDTRFAYLGPRTAYSKRKFKKYNDSRIIEKDRVSEEEKIAALADCTVFCLPSRQESFGGVYTEAWMQGKPVIGADIPAVAELIQAGQDGELVSESSGELANTIIKLLSQPEHAAAMGRRGHEKVKKQFNWGRIANLQRSIYFNLIKSCNCRIN